MLVLGIENFEIIMDLLVAFSLGLVVSAASAPIAIKICKSFGLMDEPSKRKQHQGQIPLAGGLMLLSALTVFGFMVESITPLLFAILFAAPLLFLIGAIDDRTDLPAKRKLLLQGLVGIALVVWLGVRVSSLDNVVTGAPLALSVGVSVLFSIACFCGVLNAANMVDGIDGLLGTLSMVSLMGVGWLFFVNGYEANLALVLVLLGALAGYLVFNLGVFGQQFKIFLGDSGSLVVGLSLFALLVSGASPEATAFTPTSAGWLLGIPLIDTISVMLRRMLYRRSPFEAGRDHLHHLMLELKFSRHSVLGFLVMFHLSLVLVGVTANYSDISQAVFFWAFVLMTALVTIVSAVIERSIGRVQQADSEQSGHEIQADDPRENWIPAMHEVRMAAVDKEIMDTKNTEEQNTNTTRRRPLRVVS